MMINLPPLTEKLDKGEEGKKDFDKLLKILLTNYGHSCGFTFKIDPLYKESGIDGLVEVNHPTILCPAIFHFKWLHGPINKSSYARQIETSFKQSLESTIKYKAYVLVIPHKLSVEEKVWLQRLERTYKEYRIRIYFVDHEEIMRLLMESTPALIKYFYPEWEPGTEPFAKVYKRYVEAVANELKYLEFIGLPTGQYQRQELLKPTELIKVYIPIQFEKDEIGTLRLSLTEVIKKSRCCVILGTPGSGKSTLAKYLALAYSQKIPHDELNVENKIPFIIHVRDFVRIQRSKTGSFDFIDYLKYMAEMNYGIQEIDRDFFVAMLELGKAIVLFDGLDEVSSREKRIKIAEDIKKFADTYLHTVVWITSRIFGYTQEIKKYTGTFDVYYLRDVSDEQADKFIETWYKTQIPSRKIEREQRIALLKKAAAENKGVKLLRKNPLLLTMMTLVHQFEGTLPDDRGKLYEKCIELLLKTWQDKKYITQGEENPLEKRGIKYDEQLRLLSATAFNIQLKTQDEYSDSGRGLIRERELYEVLLKNRYDPRRLSKDKAREDIELFINYIRDRVGLFVESGKDFEGKENIFKFIHLSFLEYLCAYQLSEDKSKSQEEHIKELLDYMGKSSWGEIILLSLYIFSKSPGGNSFIDRFTEQAFEILSEGQSSEGWQLLGRAVRDNINFALDDIKRIVSELVEQWLNNPHPETTKNILNEIHGFSKEGKEYLKEILEEIIEKGTTPKALASLYLFIKWFPINAKFIESIRNNPDHLNVLPHLPVFRSNELLSQYIDTNMKVHHWDIYYNSARDNTVQNIDRLINYRINEPELTGYIISSWSKIFEAIQERKLFTEINPAADIQNELEYLTLDFEYILVKYPLNLFRHFMDTPEAYLDTPGNIKVSQISDDEIFKSQEKSVKAELNQAYIMKWLNNTLDHSLGELKNKLPTELSKGDSTQLSMILLEFCTVYSKYLGKDFISYLDVGFIYDFNKLISNNSIRSDFTHYKSRDFGLYLSQDYKGGSKWHISRTFSRFFDPKYSQNLGCNFIRYFTPYFTEDICQDFIKTQNYRFESQFKKIIEKTYDKFFKKKLDWDTVDEVKPAKIHRCFIDQFIEHNQEFIETFFHYFHHYLFFDKAKILFEGSVTSGFQSKEKQKFNIPRDKRKIKMRKRFMVPFTFDFILICAFHHYIIKILAHLNQKFNKRRELNDLTKTMIEIAVENFCRKYPFYSYILREIWPIYAGEFNRKLQPNNHLNNLRLACFITNAAKVSLITDMPAVGSEWEKILQEAEISDDTFVQVALTLYKIAIFENRHKNSYKLYTAVRHFREKYTEYFKMIGFEIE